MGHAYNACLCVYDYRMSKLVTEEPGKRSIILANEHCYIISMLTLEVCIHFSVFQTDELLTGGIFDNIIFTLWILFYSQLSKESNHAKQLEVELKSLQTQHADSLAQVKHQKKTSSYLFCISSLLFKKPCAIALMMGYIDKEWAVSIVSNVCYHQEAVWTITNLAIFLIPNVISLCERTLDRVLFIFNSLTDFKWFTGTILKCCVNIFCGASFILIQFFLFSFNWILTRKFEEKNVCDFVPFVKLF